MATQPLIDYKILWRPSGHQPGAETGTMLGAGDQLHSVVPLREQPDPRRIDLRTSLRDPFDTIWVRDFYLNTALKVIVLIDSSASMGFQGQVDRFSVAQDITAQLALSAYRNGDAFGLYIAGESLNKKQMLPTKANRSAWLWINKHLPQVKPTGKHADGLFEAIAYLPQSPSLVFILSDFRWQPNRLNSLLKKVSHHDVVPIVLQDPVEIDAQPQSGISMLQDVETGESKFVWMRKGLQQKLKSQRQQHIDDIQRTCRRFSMRPFVVQGEFETARLTQYFMSQ